MKTVRIVNNSSKSLFQSYLHPSPHLARGQIPQDPRDQLLDVRVGRSPKQIDQRGDTARVLDGPLVLVVLPPVRQVPQCAARVPVHVRIVVVEQLNQGRYTAQATRLLLVRVVHVAQVLQVSGGVRLDYVVRVAEETDHLRQIRVPPSHRLLVVVQRTRHPGHDRVARLQPLQVDLVVEHAGRHARGQRDRVALVVAGHVAGNLDRTHADARAVSDRPVRGRGHVTVGHFVLVWKTDSWNEFKFEL